MYKDSGSCDACASGEAWDEDMNTNSTLYGLSLIIVV